MENYWYFILLQCSRCAVLLYSFIICSNDIANCKFVDMYHKYLNNAWFLSGFKVGVGKIYVSRGCLNFLPTSAMLNIASVTYIGVLLHENWYVLVFWTSMSWLPRPFPVIACVLFSNQWYFSMIFPLWFLLARYQNIVWGYLHIDSKVPQNQLYASTTTTATMPNYNTTFHKELV